MITTTDLRQHVSEAIAKGGSRILRTRKLMRAPIWLFRARLGVVFGSRMLMLEHIGRKSGERRYVVLEVFDHPQSNVFIVPSGFGTKSQWFRNIQANPQVRVTVGSRSPVVATARRLTQEEADESLRRYIDRHAQAWQKFKSVVERTLGSEIHDHNTELPLIELTLRQGVGRR